MQRFSRRQGLKWAPVSDQTTQDSNIKTMFPSCFYNVFQPLMFNFDPFSSAVAKKHLTGKSGPSPVYTDKAASVSLMVNMHSFVHFINVWLQFKIQMLWKDIRQVHFFTFYFAVNVPLHIITYNF